MRAALLLSSLIALLTIGWWWSAVPDPPAPVAPTATGSPATDLGTPPPAAIPGPARTTTIEPLGTIRGRVVDAGRRPLAGASVALVHDGADAPGQQATTGDDGRFTLFQAPLAACAVRVEAPGFGAAQVGDLHPEQAAHHDLDLGDFVLHAAVLYTGIVQSAGRPLAGAQLTLRPVLGEPGAPTPLVQRTTSGADGTFVFAQGMAPPSLLEATAAGHWPASMRRLDAPPPPLVIELAARPRVRGRVIEAETGRGVAAAPLWVIPLEGNPRVLRPGGQREPAPHRTDRDGNFDVEPPPSPWFAVEAGGDHVVPAISPVLHAAAAPTPIELRLHRGVAIHGTVTWHGDPVAGTVTMLTPITETGPVSFGTDGTFRLGPCPAGTWTLRVDGERGARHEQPLQLTWPGPLQVAIALGDGVQLVGRVTGPEPGWSKVVCQHETGLLRTGLRQADGSYAVAGLSPGRWSAWVVADGSDWRSVATNHLLARMPQPAVQIVADQDARLDLRHPTELLGSLHGRVDLEFAAGRITLSAASDHQIDVPPMLLQTQVGDDGTFALGPLPPGSWQVELVRAGQSEVLRRTRVLVEAGVDHECRFD